MKEVAGTFGKAKPLPGQQGYKLKESERLEHKAREMEAQLQQVKHGMAKQAAQRERDKTKMKGGNRWRSAREDRGSVRQYAQDVKTKTTTKRKQKPVSHNSKDQGASQWSAAQVIEWLGSIGLSHHASSFEFNEISGSVLLELTPADLDYLQVTQPAERKVVLQQVEQLKRSAGVNIKKELPIPQEIVDDKLQDSSVPSTQKKPTHWSQLKPLNEKQVKGGERPVNLADGEFDEADSHASFMKALLDWRATDENTKEEKDAGFWTNPLSDIPTEKGGELLQGDFNEAEGHAGFLAALQAWRGRCSDNQQPEQVAVSTESHLDVKRSCWQCYKLCPLTSIVLDSISKKEFCSTTCQSHFQTEYARFYKQ